MVWVHLSQTSIKEHQNLGDFAMGSPWKYIIQRGGDPDGLQQDRDQQGYRPPAVLNIKNIETFEENPKERQDFLLNYNDSETP